MLARFSQRLVLPFVQKRFASGGHGHHGNAPPLCTVDDLPIPKKSYKEEFDKFNTQGNMYAAAGLAFALSAIIYALTVDMFEWGPGGPPEAYKKRTNEFYTKEYPEV